MAEFFFIKLNYKINQIIKCLLLIRIKKHRLTIVVSKPREAISVQDSTRTFPLLYSSNLPIFNGTAIFPLILMHSMLFSLRNIETKSQVDVWLLKIITGRFWLTSARTILSNSTGFWALPRRMNLKIYILWLVSSVPVDFNLIMKLLVKDYNYRVRDI